MPRKHYSNNNFYFLCFVILKRPKLFLFQNCLKLFTPVSVLWPRLKWFPAPMMQVAVRHIFDKISSVLLPFPSKNSWIWLFNCNLIGWRQKITDCVTAFLESYCGLGNDGQVPWAKAVFYSHLDSYTDNMLVHQLLWVAHLAIKWTNINTETAPRLVLEVMIKDGSFFKHHLNFTNHKLIFSL